MRVALIVDNPYRDLPGLALTAMYLCQHGATCYLVPMNLARREIWPLAPDFVLLHHLRTVTQELAREMMQVGMKVGVLDTEGGVLASLEAYARTMAPDPSVRHEIACFCSWGSKIAGYTIEKDWYLDGQVAVTGSPRSDFYVYPWREAALKNSPYVDRFPTPIVLINGNFPLANPGFQTPEGEIRLLVERLGFDENEVLRWQQVQRDTMLGMCELANHLAARFPHVTFVYRPHPFERMETYSELLDSRSNLHLVRQGTVDGWILRANAIIQRSCSTAIEAGLAGVPAFSPTWIPTPVVMEAAEAVSLSCETEQDLVTQLDAALQGQLEIPRTTRLALDQVVAEWFHRSDGKAHERVGDCILRALEGTERQVRLDRCQNNITGRGDSKMALKTRASGLVKRTLGIPSNWSFRHMRYRTANIAWDHSEKFFDADQVRVLVDAIAACPRAEGIQQLDEMGVELSQQHGDYHFGHVQGRSVTVFPH